MTVFCGSEQHRTANAPAAAAPYNTFVYDIYSPAGLQLTHNTSPDPENGLGGAWSTDPAVSPDGRLIAFDNAASDQVGLGGGIARHPRHGCGTGADTVLADPADALNGCETVRP